MLESGRTCPYYNTKRIGEGGLAFEGVVLRWGRLLEFYAGVVVWMGGRGARTGALNLRAGEWAGGRAAGRLLRGRAGGRANRKRGGVGREGAQPSVMRRRRLDWLTSFPITKEEHAPAHVRAPTRRPSHKATR